jgi:hypothetical protein
MATKILQIDLQNDITPQIGSYDNAGGVAPNNWLKEGNVYSLGPTNGQGTTPYYWFTSTREVTDFDLCWEDYQDHEQTTQQFHLEIGDSAGNVMLSVFQQYGNYQIGPVHILPPAYQTWHKILVEIRKASASSSTVTVYVDGKKVVTGTSDTLLTSAKIALLGHVPNIGRWQNAGQRLRYVTIYDRSYTSKGINLDGMMTIITGLLSKLITKLSTVAFTGSYNDLSNKPTISTVNNAALTIQRNGTNVQTFTANQSTNVTANISVPTKTSDLTNDSGFLTSHQDLSDYVPKSGGAVMTGDLLASSTTNSMGFGYGWGNGGTVYTYSPTHSTTEWQGTIRLEPLKTTSDFKTMQLAPNGTWTWSGTACQITSDQRLKQQITEIDDKLLDAWEDVELVQFKYKESVDTKGKSARLHTGYVVQQIDSACKSHGIDVSAYGLYCHEEYPEETKEVEVEQADGTKTKEIKVIREANEHYSLRYTEALIVECKYLRRCIVRLTARIEELEKGNNIK